MPAGDIETYHARRKGFVIVEGRTYVRTSAPDALATVISIGLHEPSGFNRRGPVAVGYDRQCSRQRTPH
jgi:hypothetical protein